jgi:hypothetical protein
VRAREQTDQSTAEAQATETGGSANSRGERKTLGLETSMGVTTVRGAGAVSRRVATLALLLLLEQLAMRGADEKLGVQDQQVGEAAVRGARECDAGVHVEAAGQSVRSVGERVPIHADAEHWYADHQQSANGGRRHVQVLRD